ncbi:MAG: glycosyltransferase family 4 protein [Patescibacteria group bacterium]|jgi:glycosyltransferase involved in cell wall biosynthesis
MAGTRRLRIAQVAPLSERVPPKMYGGTERVIYALTEELVRRGHEVTLFASGDSTTSARLESVYPRSLREARILDHRALDLTLLNIAHAYRQNDQFDIIHDHHCQLVLPTAQFSPTPVVLTLHGPVASTVRKLFGLMPRPSLVAISNSQAKSAPELNIEHVVYNGLDLQHYPFQAFIGPEPYLLHVGRISEEKGTDVAIEVAQALDMPLIIAAKLDQADLEYFNRKVAPKLSGDRIKWVGEVDEAERNRLMTGALCLLNPIQWREPFGLVMIEAMACGLPVISFANGSAPELIKHGVTGFLVSDAEEMIDAVSRVRTLDRRACRDHALTAFSASAMADGYEAVYEAILANQQHRVTPAPLAAL